ncbi:MAG TPA: DNA-binding protein [Pseudobdellovibrionaceae bacterium]|nr:DNA-binding protein [Pseudobdellovibrionaceae bacterium]
MTIFRLRPGADLKKFLSEFASSEFFQGGFVVTCVGSLSQVKLRLAQANSETFMAGPFEILSLNGTLSKDGVHLHLGIADGEGRAFGGHLLDGCIVLTTVEIVIEDVKTITLAREFDPETGYRELVVKEQEGNR